MVVVHRVFVFVTPRSMKVKQGLTLTDSVATNVSPCLHWTRDHHTRWHGHTRGYWAASLIYMHKIYYLHNMCIYDLIMIIILIYIVFSLFQGISNICNTFLLSFWVKNIILKNLTKKNNKDIYLIIEFSLRYNQGVKIIDLQPPKNGH